MGTERLFDKLPPHSSEAEQCLLGALLLDIECVHDVLAVVQSGEAFWAEKHGAIYDAILAVYDETNACDIMLVVGRLERDGKLSLVGGAEYVSTLLEVVPSSVNAVHYARIVADTHARRRLIDIHAKALHAGYHPDGTVAQQIDDVEAKLYAVRDSEDGHEPAMVSDIIVGIADRPSKVGLPTGYADLDHMLGGLMPGDMIILAARPSVGKTALALNIAEQVASGGATPWEPAGTRVPVGVFSMEMSRESLCQRLVSARTGIPGHRIRACDLACDDWRKLDRDWPAYRAMPLCLDDSVGLTPMSLRSKARRMVARFGVRCIVIDYMQLMTDPQRQRDGRQNEVSSISRQIKALARELDVPIVALCQLNRQATHREANRPKMSDLRESGSIEQDADVVLLLHRDAYYHIDDEQWLAENEDRVNLAEVIVAKQRNGPTGVVKLTWDEQTMRFKSWTGRGYDEAEPMTEAELLASYPDEPPF